MRRSAPQLAGQLAFAADVLEAPPGAPPDEVMAEGGGHLTDAVAALVAVDPTEPAPPGPDVPDRHRPSGSASWTSSEHGGEG
jgi:hypothetical protein